MVDKIYSDTGKNTPHEVYHNKILRIYVRWCERPSGVRETIYDRRDPIYAYLRRNETFHRPKNLSTKLFISTSLPFREVSQVPESPEGV